MQALLPEILVAADPIAVLLVLIATGYAAFRLGILDRHTTHTLSVFLLNVSIPALIIVSMQMPLSDELISGAVVFTLGLSVFYLFSVTIAYFARSALQMDAGRGGVFSFAILFGNVGFMGFPISAALFGPESIFYVAIANLAFYLLIFSAGIVMMTGKYEFNPRLLLNPGIIAACVGLTFFMLEIRIPSPLIDGMSILGDLTTPLAMVIIGSLLATFPFWEMIGDKSVFWATVLRLFGLPIGTFFLLSPLIGDPLMLGILVILAGMPAGSMTAIFADIYRADEQFASQLVFVSTLLSLVTIPIIAAFLI